MEPSIYIAVKNNFYIGAETSSLSRALGSGKHLRSGLDANKDSIILEHYTVSGKDLFVLSTLKKEGGTAKVSS